jgi:hypothetical protein
MLEISGFSAHSLKNRLAFVLSGFFYGFEAKYAQSPR